MKTDLKSLIAQQATIEGFAATRITRPDVTETAAQGLADFLAAGRHGQMTWMERRAEWRGDPRALWPDVSSVIMLAEVYTPEVDPFAAIRRPDRGAISVYARGADYHDLVKKRLKRLGRWLIERAGGEIKVFVDTAPVMEKPLASSAGLGWQGKHTNLVSRELGSWFFLGAIFTSIDLEPDPAEVDHCGSCRACLDVCPTDAFPAPYQLDARRCISYLTIEHRGPVDEELRAGLGNRIYGCDDCLAVCPWNKFAQAATESGYANRSVTDAPELARLAALDDPSFREMFRKSPIKRIGRDRFVRNVAYAIGNSGDPNLKPVLEPLLRDKDDAVADAASWAKARLSGQSTSQVADHVDRT